MHLDGQKFGWGMAAVALACCLAGVSARASLAQTAPAVSAVSSQPPVYDVVTIRPNNSGTRNTDIDSDVNTYAATNVTLGNLIHDAYDIQPDLISGGPKWMESSRFDLRAKVVDTDLTVLKNQPREDQRRMLRVLLAERFHLQAHTEVKTLPVYELVVTKGGSKLTAVAPGHEDDSFQGASAGSMNIYNGNLTAAFRSMANFADTLSGQVHRTVIDKTGLPGHYNFQLSWTREDGPASENATAPPLFTALEEQLGLKLVAGKGPVTTLVIDRADLPKEEEN